MELSDTVAVITGAAGRAGRAAVRALADQGAALVLVGRRAARLEALVAELGLPSNRCLALPADVGTAAGAQAAAAAALSRFGRVDIVLHLVGGWMAGQALADMPAGQLEAMLQQNVWTTFYVAQAFAPALAASGRGRFLVVSSPAAARPPARSGAYAAAKAAQEALVLTLAQELGPAGATANILQVRNIDVEHQRLQAPSAENASWTTPEELAAALTFLCSPNGGRLTGARLPLFASPA